MNNTFRLNEPGSISLSSPATRTHRLLRDAAITRVELEQARYRFARTRKLQSSARGMQESLANAYGDLYGMHVRQISRLHTSLKRTEALLSHCEVI